MEVNFFGAVRLTKAFLPLIRQSKGRIINVSSIAGLTCSATMSTYSGSKYALEGFTDSLRKEMRPLGVAVTLVNPGFVMTKIAQKNIDMFSALQPEPSWLAIYGPLLSNTEAKVRAMFATADTTEVTDAAILDAALAAKPFARYFVANVSGVPVWVLALLVRVLPTPLIDYVAVAAMGRE
jgi:short-subunit dehydrogenase